MVMDFKRETCGLLLSCWMHLQWQRKAKCIFISTFSLCRCEVPQHVFPFHMDSHGIHRVSIIPISAAV